MPGLTLDAGALVAFERNERAVVTLMARAFERGYTIAVPAGVVGQIWRDGRRQARLARFLGATEVQVVTLDDRLARESGQLCGVSGTRDVIDASLVLCARIHGHTIVTADVSDIRRLDPAVPIIAV